ncbi:MAG: glycosyltransferase family 2 protein [Henriciella sp.]|nr:glycosyltransferase family 2 protein [Henriciella sp.]
MPKFSIIIVSYESEDWIEGCLEGLQQQTFEDFEVIVVDNASKDRSAALAEAFDLPDKTVISAPKNLGFARGCNLGERSARGEWLVFLNPDTVARPDWLQEVVNGQKRYPATSVFASAQYEIGATNLLDGVGDAYFGFGIPWRGGFGHPVSALPEEGECFSPCGAAAVVRREVFRKVGGFDKRFFCYCEDVDLGFRLRLAGERCVFLKRAAIDHKGSAISGRYSDFTVYHGTRNRMWTYFKNMPLGLLLLTAPGHIAISLYLLVRSASNGTFRPTLRGLIHGLVGLPGILKSRKRYASSGPRVNIANSMTWNVNDLRKRRPSVREFEAIEA